MVVRTSADGCPRNGYLFPSRRPQTAWSRRDASARVTSILLEAGVDRARAHCHAFRKGYVTALLRAGNPITSVQGL